MSGLPDPGAAFARLADIAEHVETYYGIALEHFNAAEELERLGEPAKAEAALIVCGIATLASATAEALAERDLDAPDADDAATGERLALACRAVTGMTPARSSPPPRRRPMRSDPATCQHANVAGDWRPYAKPVVRCCDCGAALAAPTRLRLVPKPEADAEETPDA